MDTNMNDDRYLINSNSPHIFDADMTDTSMKLEPLFFEHALDGESPLYGEHGYPASPFQSSVHNKTQQLPKTTRSASNENGLSASSESSTQDSSSDSSGRHKRQTSSRSSHSLNPTRPARMVGPGNRSRGHGPGNYPTQGTTFGFGGTNFDEMESSNRAMESQFDFDSAANTPSPLTSASSIATSGPGTRFVAIPQDSPMQTSAVLQPHSRASMDAQINSPFLQMTNAAFLPNTMQTSHTSPASSDDFLDMTTLDAKMPMVSPDQQTQSMYADPNALTAASSSTGSSQMNSFVARTGSGVRKTPSQLIVHPTPQKSRVETQIPIKMTLFPMPPGIKRLHLPSHTISKPKLLAKPPPGMQPDMLELTTSLVCTSAMQDAVKLKKALDRAVDGRSNVMSEARRSSSGDGKAAVDPDDDPLNGGDVQICAGCINRERKRAARKKSKKPEEDEPWQKNEAKRVIVFNTNEIKEWQEPSVSNVSSEAKDEDSLMQQKVPPANFPEGAMQIDVPMRIACYCRHKSEKMGFQVVLTIKDHVGKLVAQTITNPIMITDDHKTHAPPASLSNANGLYFDQIALPGGSMIAREPLDSFTNGLHRNAHSTNDLQSLQNQFNPFGPQIAPFAVPQNPSQNTSATLTPRNLSRQASPSDSGNVNKKRKGSGGAIRLPDSLQMTRMQGGNVGSSTPNWPLSAGLSNSSNSGSLYMGNVGQPMPMSQQSSQFQTTPASPDMVMGQSSRSQSFENLSQVRSGYSQPSSSHPSRAGSPNSTQAANVSLGVLPGNQIQTGFGVNAIAQASRNPVIHKLIPNEGPKAGGIEVTCLGSGFTNGLEIMFGDCLATTTTFWGETSLVCLLPPASRAGNVPVTFKHQYLQMKAHKARFPGQALPRQQLLFKYVDDDEQELLRQALQLLHHKMHGTFGEVTDIARSIVNGASGGMGAGSMDGGQMSNRQGGNFDAETAVLKCLEMIDLDDSPHEPRLNMRRKNGQSILHLAASLGHTRLVAGLLARGANPDVRDLNGLSPMHMAAINGHAGIVTRLRRARGDPRMRSLLGFTPADMAANESVLEAVQALSHARSQSLGMLFADRSRTSSISSTVSRRRILVEESAYEYDYSDESDDEASEVPRISSRHATPSQPWARSRRNSLETEMIQPSLDASSGNIFPAAAMTAWRDSLAAQIQQFHQSVSWNLPNLQLPNLPSLPTIPENYQAGSMVRRFSSLVPQRSSSPTSEGEGRAESKESVSRVWDLLTGSGASSPAPPAYDEIYPTATQRDLDTKTASATRAAADAAADQKCATLFDAQTTVASSSSSSVVRRPVHINGVELTEEERQALVAERQQRMKKLKSDRKLFFVWIPILLFVVLAVLKNQVPQLWQVVQTTYAQSSSTAPPLREPPVTPQARVVEVE